MLSLWQQGKWHRNATPTPGLLCAHVAHHTVCGGWLWPGWDLKELDVQTPQCKVHFEPVIRNCGFQASLFLRLFSNIAQGHKNLKS